MSVLADPGRSRAILVGTSAYDTFDQLPAVAANLTGLRSALIDPAVWGLRPDHCAVLPDPQDALLVMDTLQHAAASATDTLVVYIAGHALIDGTDGDLYLALSRSNRERLYRTALPYDWIRLEVRASHAMRAS